MAGTLTISTLSDGTNSTSSTNCIQGSAMAWVRFNGNPTVAIAGSYNVSSVTRNATGDYTINFTNAMVDTNYSAVSSNGNGTANTVGCSTFYGQAPTTTTVRICTYNGATSLTDYVYISTVVFR